jgi:Tol biopolymer transport system component
MCIARRELRRLASRPHLAGFALAALAAVAVAAGGGAAAPRSASGVEKRAGAHDRILFDAYSPDGQVRLLQIDGDGSNRREAPGTQGPLLGRAAWSPDGAHLAFIRRDALYVVNLDGSGKRRLAAPVGSFAWSPDGRRLIHTDGWGQLLVIDLTGRAVRDLTPPLTSPRSKFFGVSWSPDGRWIGFIRSRGEVGTATCCSIEYDLMRPDGTGLRRLLRAREGIHDSPVVTWSPDGKSLAVVSDTCTRCLLRFAVVDPATGRSRRVAGPAPSVGEASISWSPDSKRLIFASGGQLRSVLSGSRVSRGIPQAAPAEQALQSPDGRTAVFSSEAGDGAVRDLQLIPAGGGVRRLLTRLPAGWTVSLIEWRRLRS